MTEKDKQMKTYVVVCSTGALGLRECATKEEAEYWLESFAAVGFSEIRCGFVKQRRMIANTLPLPNLLALYVAYHAIHSLN